MLKTATREIGGKTYQVTQLGAEPGQRIFFGLMKLVGPSIAALLKQWRGQVDENGKPKVTFDTAAAAISELMRELDYGTFREFVDTFMTATEVVGANGQRVKLSDMKAIAFAGDYAGLMKWLAFSLEVNFSSFFADMGPTSPQS